MLWTRMENSRTALELSSDGREWELSSTTGSDRRSCSV